MPPQFRSPRLPTTIFLTVLLLGCPPHLPEPKHHRFDHQEEAGSVQIGVQSVAPFEEYIDSLQPEFQLDEEGAFEAAITQTQIQQIRQAETLLARIAVALASSTRSVEEVETRTDDEVESSRTETESVTPPAAPSASAPTADSLLASLSAAPSDEVALDAFAQYSAAASLFQHVALINSYVRDAAVSTGTVPYVVRLIVSVLPSARSAPYDAYATVSFFLAARSPGRSPVPYFAYQTLPSRATGTGRLGCDGRQLQVVPLFVTDNLESSSTTASRGALWGFEGEAGGIVGNVGLGAGLNRRSEASSGTRGNVLNGIQTVAATSANTLQLRMGAANAQGTHWAVPRTFNLTTLVLVPMNFVQEDGGGTEVPVLACNEIEFVGRSHFQDVETGRRLPGTSARTLGRSLKSLIHSETCAGRRSIPTMVAAARELDFPKFSEGAGVECPDADPRSVWPLVVDRVAAAGRSRGSIPLTQRVFAFFAGEGNADPPTIPPILDDGKTARVSLTGGERLEADGLRAELIVSPGDGKTDLTLLSRSISVTPDRRGAEIVFPSLKSFFADKNQGSMPESATLRVEYAPTLHRWTPKQNQVFYRWQQEGCPILAAKPEPDPTPGYALRATSDFIRAGRDGRGEVAIEIDKKSKKAHPVFLRVSGAIVESVSPELTRRGAYHVAEPDRVYLLSLKNLVGGTMVQIHSWRLEGEKQIPAPSVSLMAIQQLQPDRRSSPDRPEEEAP